MRNTRSLSDSTTLPYRYAGVARKACEESAKLIRAKESACRACHEQWLRRERRNETSRRREKATIYVYGKAAEHVLLLYVLLDYPASLYTGCGTGSGPTNWRSGHRCRCHCCCRHRWRCHCLRQRGRNERGGKCVLTANNCSAWIDDARNPFAVLVWNFCTLALCESRRLAVLAFIIYQNQTKTRLDNGEKTVIIIALITLKI